MLCHLLDSILLFAPYHRSPYREFSCLILILCLWLWFSLSLALHHLLRKPIPIHHLLRHSFALYLCCAPTTDRPNLHFIRYHIDLASDFEHIRPTHGILLVYPELQEAGRPKRTAAPDNDLELMERPAKRQKLSQEPALAIPSRTINLEDFQRSQNRKRNGGKVILPRVPDVTVTAAVVEVAVNDGSSTTQIAAPTTDVALTLSDLGTLTVPAASVGTKSATISSQSSSVHSSGSSSSRTNSASASESTLAAGLTTTSINRNSTTFASDSGNTVTVTATSTLHISYDNGSFLPITSSQKSNPTDSSMYNDLSTYTDTGSGSSSRSTSRFDFNQGSLRSTTLSAAATGAGSPYYSSNNDNNGAIGATNTGSASQPTSSTGNGSGAAPPVLTPQQTRMVGGIVGGIAGIAMVLVVLLYVLRWYRGRLKNQGRLPQQLTSSHTSRDFGVSGLMGCAAPMSQSRTALFSPAAAAGAGMKKWRPGSDMTTLTNFTSTTGDSERGFQRVSGRKIPSVLSTGGDQFGGSYGAFEKESGALYRSPSANPFASDADSAYGFTPPHRPASRSAPTTPSYPAVFAGETQALRSPSMSSSRPFGLDEFQQALGRNTSKPDGVAVFHSSPARTPVMQSPNTSTLKIPSQAPVTMDADIPEMPLPSPGLNSEFHNIGIAIGTPIGERRIPSGRLSARSGAGSGKFKEDIE